MTAVATNQLSYNGFVTELANLAVEPAALASSVMTPTSSAFAALIPGALNYAELRIQRDVDLLPLQTSGSYSTAALVNVLTIPVADFVTIQTLSIAGAPLTMVSKEFLQNVYGSSAGAAQPIYSAPYGGDAATAGKTSSLFLLGPYPDGIYTVSVTGTVRMPSLYLYANATDAANKYTFISTWLPDLLVQAAMIYVSEFQRNFSSTGSDPQMPISFEQQYQALLRGAQVEEARKRFSASAWSSMAPPVAATPAR